MVSLKNNRLINKQYEELLHNLGICENCDLQLRYHWRLGIAMLDVL